MLPWVHCYVPIAPNIQTCRKHIVLEAKIGLYLLAQYAAGRGTNVQVASELICKLLRLGEQASMQGLEDEAALLVRCILSWLEEAEEH